MDSATFGLSITGSVGVALLLIWTVIKRGMKSKCLVKGMSISIDIHQQTDTEKQADEKPQTEIKTTPSINTQMNQVMLDVVKDLLTKNNGEPKVVSRQNTSETPRSKSEEAV